MVSIEVRSITENSCWQGSDHISEKLLTCGLQEASRPFDFCKLDLMDHRWPKPMAIWKFNP